MQVRSININPIRQEHKELHKTYKYQQPVLYSRNGTDVAFFGIQTQKEFRELTRNRIIHCFYCKTPMINPKYIEELKEQGVFSRPIKEFVQEIAPYKEYLKPHCLEIFNKIETFAKVAPQTHLSQIIQILHNESIKNLREIQRPILEQIEQEGNNLSPKCRKEFKRIMQLHKNRLDGIPQIEEFSAKDFGYKIKRCCETITNQRIQYELIQYANAIDHPAFKEEILQLPQKVLRTIFKDASTLNYSFPINARSIQTYIIESIKQRGIKLERNDIIELCKNAEKMLSNTQVIVPFSNKNLGYDISETIKNFTNNNIYEQRANNEAYEKIKRLLKKLPTSESNKNSFITKYRRADDDTIGYYLLKPSNCTIEHLIVESRHIPIVNKIWDWVLACGPCNNKRSDGNLAKYLEQYPLEHQQTYFNDIAGVVNDEILDLSDFLIQRNIILNEGHIKLSISKISPELLQKEFGGNNPQLVFDKYIELADEGLIAREDLKELKILLQKKCGIKVQTKYQKP